MIPACLHYCWFGNAPEPHQAFRDRWRALHPGYCIIRWDELNSPTEHPYLQAVLKQRKYSKAADFMRLWLMIYYGGIYLDVDVECVRSLEPLRTRTLFLGFQRERGFDMLESINSAVIGAHRGHWAAVELMRRLLESDAGDQPPMNSGPRLVSRLLLEMGLQYSDKEQCIDSSHGDPIYVLPRRAFYPFSWEEPCMRSKIEPDTFTVHHWDGSWVEEWRASRAAQRNLSELGTRLEGGSPYLVD